MEVIAICLLTFGCSNPVTPSQQSDFVPQGWEVIAICPFTGDERFAGVAADEFAARLRTKSGFRIIPPAEVAPTVRRLGIVGPPAEPHYGVERVDIGIAAADAQKIGRALNAHAVIVATVRVVESNGSNNGLCLAQLIDVASGETVGTSSYSTGLRPTSSERDCASMATARAAKDMLEILVELSVKNRPRTPSVRVEE